MKTLKIILTILTIALFCSQSIAQPFELDPKIQPFELALKPDLKTEGALGIAAITSVDKEPSYYFVTGHDVFQPIDIYIFCITSKENFSVELVKDSWNDLIERKSSSSSKNGIINLKLRAWGAFGIKILPLANAEQFSILVKAGAPIKEYLGSPFVEATKNNTSDLGEKSVNSTSETAVSNNIQADTSSSNIFLYIIIGLLLVIVGILGWKFLGRNKTASILLILFLYNSHQSFAFNSGSSVFPITKEGFDAMEKEFREIYEGQYNTGLLDLALEKLKESIDGLGDVIEMGTSAYEFAQSHKSLSDCINATPLPGEPRIPSFCTTNDCSSCYKSARQKFNHTRYQFEKLSAIYNCTIEYSKKAISLGDNTSGIHAVSGMAWQIQRREIEKSVDELKKAYDNRYGLLLKDLQEAMNALNICEAEHGLEDWFDRFGYIYYEFIKDKYKRGE